MPSLLGLAAAVGFLLSLVGCLMLVNTQRWHGRLTLDSTFGVQKFHTAPTPRIGGLAILAAIAGTYAAAPPSAALLLGVMLVSAVPAFAAGFLEDLTKKIGVLDRLLATLSSGVLACVLTGSMLQHTGIAAFDKLLAFVPFAVLFTAFCIGGMANAVNIIDGFNGLAGGVVVIMLASLGLIAAQSGDTDLAYICLLIGSSVLGFLPVNWPSGKIFLGDGGAYLLGFLVACAAVMLVARNPQVSPWSPLLVCAYPVLEVAFSCYRKSRRPGSSPGAPDRVHLHMLVHRRLVKARLAGKSAWLQNAMTSPFAWLYTSTTATWAALFPQDTAVLIFGFALAALGYSRVYTRLAKFRWWPAQPQPRHRVLSPHAMAISPASNALPILPIRDILSLSARPAPPTRANPATSHSHAPVPRLARLMYAVLGASSCFALIEPAPYELLALLLMLAHTARNVKNPWWLVAGPLTATMLALLGLFAILQLVPIALQAQSPGKSAFYAGVTTMLIMIAVHLGRLRGRGDVRFSDFLAGYAAAALLSAGLALMSLHPGIALAPDLLQLEFRPKVFFKDPNVFGPYLIPATVVFLEAAGRRRGFKTILFILFAVICAAGVVSSASRAAWANLAIVLAIYGVFSSGRQKAMLACAALIAAVAAIPVAGLLLGDGMQDALELYGYRTQLQGYDDVRFAMAQKAIELGLQYPVGVGPGEVGAYLGMSGLDPHNTYVRIWAENGPVALALFSVFLLLLGAHALQECMGGRKLHPGFICAFALLAGALANASVVDTLHWRHFWVIVAVCVFSFNRRPNPEGPSHALVRVRL
jgi:UDP-N-acetylmuramyl pentapeptide phosphotransferase/UDP-N-acetylglucosamine-1-phosphate transferase/O-antigen ligase